MGKGKNRKERSRKTSRGGKTEQEREIPIMDTTEEPRDHDREEDGGGGYGGNCQKSGKLELKCTKHNATFEICVTKKPNSFTICVDDKPTHEVKNTSLEEDGTVHILGCRNYDFRLNDWLDTKNSLSPIYSQWNKNRPSHEARIIIIGILESLDDLISGDYSHGALSYPENYVIKLLHGRVEEKEKVKVEFIGVKTGSNDDMRRDDIAAVSHIIFNIILKKRADTKFPEDLLDLEKLLTRGDLSAKLKNMKVIASHSSLWHYRDRISYFGNLMKLKKQGNINEQNKIDQAFLLLPSKYKTWRTQHLPKPLDSVRRRNRYSNMPTEIGRYFRNTFEHISDEYLPKHFDHVLESEWKDIQYVEHMLTENFPELLSELHKNLIDIVA